MLNSGNVFVRFGCLILLIAAAGVSLPADSVSLTYFGDVSCDHCDVFVESYLPELEQEYSVSFDVTLVDILTSAGEEEARRRISDLGLEYRTFPVLLVGNNAYQGNYAIEKHLPGEVAHFLEFGEYRPFDREASQTRYQPAGDSASGEADDSGEPGAPGVLRFFWGEGCPYCEAAKPYLNRLERAYPYIRIERYEVYNSPENRRIFEETREHYGSETAAVPQFFFENNGWVGFSEGVIGQIESVIQGSDLSGSIDLPLFGSFDPTAIPSIAVTAAIAFVDGFNPCSLWVLTLLLGLIVHTHSRRRVLLVGGVFLTVTALVYGAFMVGFLNFFAVAGNTLIVRVLVAVIATGMGLINVKDYFAFKHGISLTISPRFQRWIGTRSRDIAQWNESPGRLAAVTALFAAGVAIVELPCTAGFPMIWSRYVTSVTSSVTVYAILLAVYLLVYLALEMGIIAVAAVSMHRIRFGVGQARILKLVGGSLMISLGGFYLFDPGIAETLSGVGFIAGTAVAATMVLVFLGRVLGEDGAHGDRKS